ncbi:MAG: hypothetical protein ACRD12_10455 [Acidimicrobiales bacterium]
MKRYGVVAASLVIGGLLVWADPAGAVASAPSSAPAGIPTRHVVLLSALFVVTAAVWVVAIVLSLPLIREFAQIRRFRSELSNVDVVALTWRQHLIEEPWPPED